MSSKSAKVRTRSLLLQCIFLSCGVITTNTFFAASALAARSCGDLAAHTFFAASALTAVSSGLESFGWPLLSGHLVALNTAPHLPHVFTSGPFERLAFPAHVKHRHGPPLALTLDGYSSSRGVGAPHPPAHALIASSCQLAPTATTAPHPRPGSRTRASGSAPGAVAPAPWLVSGGRSWAVTSMGYPAMACRIAEAARAVRPDDLQAPIGHGDVLPTLIARRHERMVRAVHRAQVWVRRGSWWLSACAGQRGLLGVHSRSSILSMYRSKSRITSP